MEMMPDSGGAVSLLVAAHRATVALRDFVDGEVVPILITQVNPTAFEEAISGLYYRLALWVSTLAALDNSRHFQAVRSGSRAAFELHMDIHLLAEDPGRAEKMFAFTKVWKYRSALKTVRFLDEHPGMFSGRGRH